MGWFSNKSKNDFPWENMVSQEVLENVLNQPAASLIFKHSTRCGISRMALSSFEQAWDQKQEGCSLFYIDLLSYRDLSRSIAERTGVIHQSPQAIVVKNGEVVYHASHHEIDAAKIQKLLRS